MKRRHHCILLSTLNIERAYIEELKNLHKMAATRQEYRSRVNGPHTAPAPPAEMLQQELLAVLVT